uniref:Uncharacterized protein n=1 Tax=Cannabis sativa TaxID=3483 RepID=A0A803QAV3_CANSA
MCFNSKLSSQSETPWANPTDYRSVIDTLQYLCYSRLAISFAVNRLSQFMKYPTSDHWGACKRVLRYLGGTMHLRLTFTPATRVDLQGHTDSDWLELLMTASPLQATIFFLVAT